MPTALKPLGYRRQLGLRYVLESFSHTICADVLFLQFSRSSNSPRANVTCSREVILAAGAIFSPTILQLSGIGPEDVLKSLEIPVRVDLPGVGANLQDHGMLHPEYSCTWKSLDSALSSSRLRTNSTYLPNTAACGDQLT